MTVVHICKNCSRTIDSDFLYCPWCGVAVAENPTNKNIFTDNTVFEKLENMQSTICEKKLNKLYSRLENIEKDLDKFVLQTEIHK